ncbi:MAG TPA: hypothetical protein ENN28_03930 [Candidatus Uhrbacteria bacterium]|nr:hypothetical protein [Candidatus Uhrbacteria bacterium]
MNTKNWILIHFKQLISKISLKLIKHSLLVLVIFALIWQFGLPRLTSLASILKDEAMIPDVQAEEISPLAELGEPSRVITVPVTAYNSLPEQTDDTPCITANGFNLCENNQQNVIAANFLPFGTKVRFPDYDPNTIYTVQDRMNARYYYKADIWMKTRPEAIQFGIQNLKMEIYQ